MPDPVRIQRVLEPRGPAAALVLTDHELAAIGGDKKTPPVRVTVNTARPRHARTRPGLGAAGGGLEDGAAGQGEGSRAAWS